MHSTIKMRCSRLRRGLQARRMIISPIRGRLKRRAILSSAEDMIDPRIPCSRSLGCARSKRHLSCLFKTADLLLRASRPRSAGVGERAARIQRPCEKDSPLSASYARLPSRGARRTSGRHHRRVVAWRTARRGVRAEQARECLRSATAPPLASSCSQICVDTTPTEHYIVSTGQMKEVGRSPAKKIRSTSHRRTTRRPPAHQSCPAGRPGSRGWSLRCHGSRRNPRL
jgi:hypothetical protein